MSVKGRFPQHHAGAEDDWLGRALFGNLDRLAAEANAATAATATAAEYALASELADAKKEGAAAAAEDKIEAGDKALEKAGREEDDVAREALDTLARIKAAGEEGDRDAVIEEMEGLLKSLLPQ